MALLLQHYDTDPITPHIPSLTNGYMLQGACSVVGGRALLQGKNLATGQSILLERLSGMSHVAMQEALVRQQSLLALEHMNIARGLPGFCHNDALYLPMVVGKGSPLSQDRRSYSQSEAVALAIQMCTFYNFLTYKELPTEQLILAPFTLYMTTSGCLKSTQLSSLIGVYMPHYRSSKQMRYRNIMRRHIYSIGTTLYHILTGQTSDSAMSTSTLTQLRPDLSKAFVAVIERMLTAPLRQSWPNTITLRYELLQLKY